MDPDQLHNILKTIIQQTRVGQLFRHPFNTGIMHASILNAYIRNITLELFRLEKYRLNFRAHFTKIYM